MTTIQKTLIATTLALALGSGIHQARQTSRLREEAQMLRRQQTSIAERIGRLQHERDEATHRLAAIEVENRRLKSGQPAAELVKLRGEAERWRTAANDPTVSTAQTSLAKIELLKQRLEQTPGAKIPEFQFLTEEDWLIAAKRSLRTDEDYRRAFAALRNTAVRAFKPVLQAALKQYLQANPGQVPTDLSQIQPFFKPPVEEAVLQRWQIALAENYPTCGVGSKWVVSQRAAVDEDYDSCAVLGPNGENWNSFKWLKALQPLVPVFKAYAAANNGKEPTNEQGQTDYSLLKPYAQTPAQQAALQGLLGK
jgi:hypothetical protein